MKYQVPAVLFAGGKSSRMGKDKALLPFDGYNSMSAYQYEKLKRIFEHVYLSTKEKKFDFNAPLIIDRHEVHSPLAGLVSVFETLDTDAVFVLSVDMPFIGEEEITPVIEASKGAEDAVIAQSPEGTEPLCGLYRRTILPMAQEQLAKNHHRLMTLLENADTTFVPFGEAQAFMNLNRPEDYEKARKLLSSR